MRLVLREDLDARAAHWGDADDQPVSFCGTEITTKPCCAWVPICIPCAARFLELYPPGAPHDRHP